MDTCKTASLSQPQGNERLDRMERMIQALVDSEEKKTKRFEDGLRLDIAAAIKPMRLETNAQVFDRAVTVEQGKISLRRFHDNKRKVGTSGGNNYNNSNKKPNTGNGSLGISKIGTQGEEYPNIHLAGRITMGLAEATI
ncbi:hypothetical protein RHSIM_Rhsim05G0170200 [Rhododendron simsii]|uniref:Uncharacterized protein n=1 Tax=Rhododendron simsii TaxID=118357 RepID=A0A834LPX4_RHOSS|nr:hypothetical protein RHSIM_Rhsim05G0170200 [Rhododendron simsii]